MHDHSPNERIPMTAHELGQLLDTMTDLVPMQSFTPPIVRVPPPFPLSAYLVMKRAE